MNLYKKIGEICGTKFVLCLVAQSCPTLCDAMDCSPPGSYVHGDSPGKNTGVGCHALLQGIFPTQGSNPGLLHCGQILYHLSLQGNPRILQWLAYLFSTGASWPRNQTRFSCTASGCFTSWATREAQNCLGSSNILAPPVLLGEARIQEKDLREPYFVHKVLYN